MFNQKYRSLPTEFVRLTPICLAMLAAGCGGSGGMSASSAAPKQSTQAGNATVTFLGVPHPLSVANSGSVTAFSQAGASFSSLVVEPAPNLAATSLAFTRNIVGASQQMYTVPANGSAQPTQLVHTTISAYPSYSRAGVMALVTQANGQFSIQTIQPDGTQAHVVLANVPGVPTISPNGQTIIYLNASVGDLYSIPAAGGTPKTIYNGANAGAGPVVWSPNNQQIAFTAKDPSTQMNTVYTMPSAGGTATNVLPSSYSGQGNAIASAWSPDGNSLAVFWTPTSSSTTGTLIISLNGGGYSYVTPSTFSDSYPCFSPDNNKIAFYRTNSGGATPGIYESDFNGLNPQLVVPDPSSNGPTGIVASLVWSPYQGNETFVGTGGTLQATSPSGFLMAQNGSQFGSLLTMTATTPSKAAITPTGSSGQGGPLAYALSADAITNISYTNVYYGSHTSIPLTLTSAAIVTIDSSTGLVDFVAPGKFENRPAAMGTHSTYSGQFSAIYDRNGQNLAPSGAKSIELDTTTGKLVSFR